MFKVEYQKYGSDTYEITNDTRDLWDIIIGITGNENAATEVYSWANDARLGDNFLNQKYKFIIRCVYNENSVYLPGDSRNKQPDIFRNQRKLQVIANEITKQTGIKNEFIGEDNDSLTWDFATGVSYMKNMNGQGLYFALNDDNGKEICTVKDVNGKEFIRKTVTVIKRREASKQKTEQEQDNVGSSKIIKNNLSIKKSGNVVYVTTTPNKEIIAAIKNAISAKMEWHGRIYDDGCWWIDLERHPYGQVRFWVGYEDKRSGNGNGSLYNIHRYEGNIRTSCEFTVKKAVANKIESVFKALEKNHIL